MSKPVSVDLKTLRAAWVHLQGLGHPQGRRGTPWAGLTQRDVNSIHGRCILVDGAAGGLWDYDPDSDVGVWGTFVPAKGALRKEIQAQCDAAATFLREESGHALIYPMENAKSRARHLASVRGLGV